MDAGGAWSDDNSQQLEGTIHFRKLVSNANNPKIDEVIQSGVVPRLVEFLARDDFPRLQVEAAWVITNIASGTSEDTKVVIDHGAVPILVKLLSSPDDDVREQAVWALANVAGDSPSCRDLVLSHGALIPLLSQFNDQAKSSMLRLAVWTLSNFCRGKPQPPFDQVRPALPALARLIFLDDIEVMTDACWALSYLSDGTNDKIQAVIEAGVCGRLVELLRTIGSRMALVFPTRYTMSSRLSYVRIPDLAVIEADLIAAMINLYRNAESDIKIEIAWALSNVASNATDEQIKNMVNLDYIKPLCDFLVCPNPRTVTVCLKGLENILKVAEAEKSSGNTRYANLYVQMIDDVGGLEKMENLKSHDDTKISEKAVKIIKSIGGNDLSVPSGGFNCL
ncbi:hypothetical protein TSUD_182360 [Trifolium subterraneum]|uniref:Importin subunit alpha n=1 Tax=Trifolium subterraneum TaxID=3900 RepID=A0A2Z6LGN6_TRISU|nr:hypothetical protein TSUD_182360 [Trifolium subterraneum]